jgi:hypothetical protein
MTLEAKIVGLGFYEFTAAKSTLKWNCESGRL